jgi:hypothetical protein
MFLDISKYLIPLDNIDLTKIISTWTWLTEEKEIIALTKSGNALLKDKVGRLYFLDTGSGVFKYKGENYNDFFENNLDEEIAEEMLLPTIIDQLESDEMKLGPDQVYSFTILPVLGGSFDAENRFIVNIYEHYNLTGDIHFQLKDLPDGTKVEINVKK